MTVLNSVNARITDIENAIVNQPRHSRNGDLFNTLQSLYQLKDRLTSVPQISATPTPTTALTNYSTPAYRATFTRNSNNITQTHNGIVLPEGVNYLQITYLLDGFTQPTDAMEVFIEVQAVNTLQWATLLHLGGRFQKKTRGLWEVWGLYHKYRVILAKDCTGYTVPVQGRLQWEVVGHKLPLDSLNRVTPTPLAHTLWTPASASYNGRQDW